MTDFIFKTDDQTLKDLSSSVQRFSESTIKGGQFKREEFQAMASLGLTGASITENHDGSDLSALAIATIIQELARVDLGPAIYLSVHLMVAKLIERGDVHGKHAQTISAMARGELLGTFCLTEAQAGSDARALQTQASKSGNDWVLRGEKIYITSAGFADIYLVFAKTAGGISAFVVEKNSPGISFGPPEKKMGCEGSPIAVVTFEECRIPDSALLGELDQGFKLAMTGLNGGRINIAAAACGVAASAIEIARKHLLERKQFGKALAEFQGLQFMLAEMLTKQRAAVLLTRDAAQALDRNERANTPAGMAKYFASDAAMSITTDAVQLLGGAGYLADYKVEKLMRDAKMLQIVEGTNQVQRMLIAREALDF
ncbi:acyl-CoA dehydrogenase family protein [bacterium]|nr:acyl-CoA dehydrogenase family protein [bacterium]